MDASTGDRLWEYRKTFEGTPDETFRSRTRSLAIYGDKIYVTTNDAHIVALDAQTGDVVWDHTVADWQRGYRYTSGAIVVKGQIVAGITGCERYKEGGCFISVGHPPRLRVDVDEILVAEVVRGDDWGNMTPWMRSSASGRFPQTPSLAHFSAFHDRVAAEYPQCRT